MDTMVSVPYLILVMLSLLKITSSFNLDYQYPIVFEDPTAHRKRETYFGYSVLLYSARPNTAWIMVGAPRANSTFKSHQKVNEPGVVYKCPFGPNKKCEEVFLDDTGNDEYHYGSYRFKDLKDGAWIGAAMDVQPGPGGRVTICGPRWIDQKHKDYEAEYYQLGVCYWMNAEKDAEREDTKATKMLPLLREDRMLKEISKKSSIYDLGNGEAGFSVHMPLIKGQESASQLVLGAPGVLNWRGGIVLYEDGSSLPLGGFNKRAADYAAFSTDYVPARDKSKENNLIQFDYFGYAVNSGYFFDEENLWYVTSAPRSSYVLGKVLIYKVHKKIREPRHITLGDNVKLSGIQCGEYFGASLAVGRINDDEYDDLIVGAPLYASEGIASTDSGLAVEEGRISVFFGSGTRQMTEVHIYGKARGGRFGAAVAYLHDLDSDGLGEIAVGAPYENEGRGAVYIYSGSKNGIITKPVQKLFAHDTYPLLRGFGSSINPYPADIDSNGCADVAVGAYKSGHAVVFRGRPVVKWKITTPSNKPKIPRNATELTMHGECVTYFGYHVPNNLTVWRILYLDPVYKRCHKNNQMIFLEKLNLERGIAHCEDIVISITDSKTKNIIEPIEIRMKYQLHQELESNRTQEKLKATPVLIKADGKSDTKDEFCKTCPISKESTESQSSFPFEVGCGLDEICLSDLVIDATLPQLNVGEFVIGSSKTLQLRIRVSNKGEPAYRTQVFIEIGSPGKIARIPPECHEIPKFPFMDVNSEKSESSSEVKEIDAGVQNATSNNAEAPGNTGPGSMMNTSNIFLRCDLDNPLPTNSTREELVEIDMKNVHASTEMSLFSFATTVSNETNPENNWWREAITFSYKADMEIIGRAGKNDLFTYSKENKNESESRFNFFHKYEVQKHGLSPVAKINIILNIPTSIKTAGSNDQINFLRLISTEDGSREQGNEVTIYEPGCYLSSYESAWPIFLFPVHERGPAVTHLCMHLKNGQRVYYNEHNIQDMLRTPQMTTLTVIFQGSESGQSFPCTVLNEVAADEPEGNGDLNPKKYEDLQSGQGYHLISNYSTTQVPSNRTLYLNCSSLPKKDEPTVKCISVTCRAGPFLNSLTLAKVLLEMEIDVSKLEKIMGLRDIILLETQGFLEIVEPTSLIQPKIQRADISWASTRFIGDIPKKHVESWVLALAIGGGIMLLLFVAMAMHKAGFFERKKKEELKSLKRKTLAECGMYANEEQEIEVEQSIEE